MAKRWLHHPVHGSRLFDEDELPRMELGWFEARKQMRDALGQAGEIRPEWNVPLAEAIRPAPKTPEQIEAEAKRSPEPWLPDPKGFASLDDYMESFVAGLDRSLKPAAAAAQKRRAIEHFAAVKYAYETKGKKLEDMAEEVRALEGT